MRFWQVFLSTFRGSFASAHKYDTSATVLAHFFHTVLIDVPIKSDKIIKMCIGVALTSPYLLPSSDFLSCCCFQSSVVSLPLLRLPLPKCRARGFSTEPCSYPEAVQLCVYSIFNLFQPSSASASRRKSGEKGEETEDRGEIAEGC
jgi:hypothetical protein